MNLCNLKSDRLSESENELQIFFRGLVMERSDYLFWYDIKLPYYDKVCITMDTSTGKAYLIKNAFPINIRCLIDFECIKKHLYDWFDIEIKKIKFI